MEESPDKYLEEFVEKFLKKSLWHTSRGSPLSGFLPKFLLEISMDAPSGNFYSSSFRGFSREYLPLEILQEYPIGIFLKFSLGITPGYPSRISPGISSCDFYKSSFREFLQDFHLGILLGVLSDRKNNISYLVVNECQMFQPK